MSSTHKLMYGNIIVGHMYKETGLVVTGLYFNNYKVSYTNMFYKNFQIRITFAHKCIQFIKIAGENCSLIVYFTFHILLFMNSCFKIEWLFTFYWKAYKIDWQQIPLYINVCIFNRNENSLRNFHLSKKCA